MGVGKVVTARQEMKAEKSNTDMSMPEHIPNTKSKLELVKKECLSLPEKSTGNFSIHTFADVAGEWLLYKKRILKETSISKYNNIINIHLLPFFREQDIHNITLEQMEAFL